MLDITNLSVRYLRGKSLALDSISFSAEQGEFIVIAGASGSGKSTLAKVILGLIPAFEEAHIKGKIFFKNKDFTNFSRKERIELLGYVPQYPSDFTTSLLVEEEIVFMLENLGLGSEKINEILEEIIELLDINHLRNRLITELSSGELQRVSLASALAFLPPILVLDEPIARIDPKAEVEFANLLRKIADKGHIVLAFEHRLDYLLGKADRLIVLDKGKLTCDGIPEKNIEILKAIDPPEISLIKPRGKKHFYLSIEEAVESFSEKPIELKETQLPEDEILDFVKHEKIVNFEDVSFSYSKKSDLILKSISFSISAGQIVGLMGINGSGKSTLLRLLSGIISPSEGSILLFDKKVKSAKKVSKDILYLPENAKLFLVGPTPLRDLERVWKDKDKVSQFYKKLGLNSLMNKKLYHLSEGERRLFALINSFQIEGKIILLDEPTIALDKNGRDMLSQFLSQAKSEGKIVIIASNDPRIYHFYDRIIVLKDKELFMDDVPRTVLYALEKHTELLPNQLVRLIQLLETKHKRTLPNIISVEEFYNYFGRDK